jgi:MFS family permease
MSQPNGGVPSPPAEREERGWRSSLAVLQNHQFRWLFLSNVAFFFAMGSQGVVRAWLAFKMTESEFALGMVMFTVALPMFFIAPIAGAVADRFERRGLIAFGQAAIVANEVVMFTLIATDSLQFWHLLAGAGVMGCVFPFIMPARAAIVFNVVGREGLANAMALNMAGMNTTRVLGPAAAGLLISLVGIKLTYGFGLFLYVLGLVCVMQIAKSHPDPEARDQPIWTSVREGLSYVGDNRLILTLLLFGLIPMFLTMPFQNLLVVFAEKIWNVGSGGLGTLSAAAGIGGVVGSMVVASWGSSRKRLRRMMISMFGFGSLLFAFALSPWFLLGLPLVLVANIFASIFGTLNNTAIQLLIPDHVRGRISSFLMMSFSLPMLGTLPMSAIAEAWGAPTAVALASVTAVVVSLLFYMLSPALRGMDKSVRAALDEDSGGPRMPMGGPRF